MDKNLDNKKTQTVQTFWNLNSKFNKTKVRNKIKQKAKKKNSEHVKEKKKNKEKG